MDNLEIYNALSEVPSTAKREITSGRLSGKTDINPMWRIKAMTEKFGPCGIGWKYEIVRFWLEHGAGNEISAFCQINLYFKNGDAWSGPVPGIGGSAFVAQEHNGPHTSDECYKMALTDAISVACKALGVAANVYWDKDPTKYSGHTDPPPEPAKKGQKHNSLKCSKCGAEIKGIKFRNGKELSAQEVADVYGVCAECLRKERETAKEHETAAATP